MSDYSIEEYNPGWVGEFQHIKEMLQSVFGGAALMIEHVGSTSVPGMKAKPIIDILVVVDDLGALGEERDSMIERGYQFQEDYVAPDTWLFRRVDEQGNKLENIHICKRGVPMEKQFLAIRDYLRAFPEEATRYAHLKDELSHTFPHDYESYRAGKADFLRNLEQKAYDWTGRCGRYV